MTPPSSGSIFRKYKPKSGRRSAFEGLENSSTATQPFGFKILRNSLRPLSTPARFRSPNAIVTASNVASLNGNASASPSISLTSAGTFSAAMLNIGRQKSVPTTRAPSISNNISDRSPVPQATSSINDSRARTLARTRLTTSLRHFLSIFSDKRWFKRSYRPAIVANISRTRPACSFVALPFSDTVKPNLMGVWLQVACKRFAISWDSSLSPPWLVVLLSEFFLAFHQELQTACDPVAVALIAERRLPPQLLQACP